MGDTSLENPSPGELWSRKVVVSFLSCNPSVPAGLLPLLTEPRLSFSLLSLTCCSHVLKFRNLGARDRKNESSRARFPHSLGPELRNSEKGEDEERNLRSAVPALSLASGSQYRQSTKVEYRIWGRERPSARPAVPGVS